MIRQKDSSTVISYHPPAEWRGTSAAILHSRFHFAGQSVYWRTIFNQSDDPTFVLLSLLWHALYAWDEALETLYQHISSLASVDSYFSICVVSDTPPLSGGRNLAKQRRVPNARATHHPRFPVALYLITGRFQEVCALHQEYTKPHHARSSWPLAIGANNGEGM